MIPLLGVVAAALLMAFGDASGQDALFLTGGAMLLVFGGMFFRRR